ncbi:winged helix-turn-helix transcriptional regulator [Euzebya sp.]|uniref:winged helix-turn-helix transcriptional regulator n=1 Tax=Euzebya sp. TaxID=1971409 RepID=UPI0035144C64
MVTRRRLDDIPCSIARALDVLGEWWTPLILRDVVYGLTRFDQIADDLPIARNVLSTRLSSLVEHGVLERHRYATGPDRYEYHLTEKGRDAFGILMALMAWGDRWEDLGGPAPVSVLCRSCDTETTPMVACSACGEALRPDRVGVRPNLGQETPRPRLVLERG